MQTDGGQTRATCAQQNKANHRRQCKKASAREILPAILRFRFRFHGYQLV
jgi:hypothetical protein